MSKNIKQKKNEVALGSNNKEKMKNSIPTVHQKGLPYYSNIRMSWVANQRHCDPDSPDRRETFIEKNIKFGEDWLGDLGWIRYYLYNIDMGYVKGKSKLVRIDKTKGFSAENCNVIPLNKPKATVTKPKAIKKESIVEPLNSNVNPANITNYVMLINNEMKLQEIIEILKTIGGQPIDDNKILFNMKRN